MHRQYNTICGKRQQRSFLGTPKRCFLVLDKRSCLVYNTSNHECCEVHEDTQAKPRRVAALRGFFRDFVGLLPVNPLAYVVTDYTGHDRNYECYEIYHEFHLLPDGRSRHFILQYNTQKVKQRKYKIHKYYFFKRKQLMLRCKRCCADRAVGAGLGAGYIVCFGDGVLLRFSGQ
jgi:hypothetical protein